MGDKLVRSEYDKRFDELEIGAIFITATGQWKVFDKGTQTLLAHRIEQDNNEEPTIFYDYEFPLL